MWMKNKKKIDEKAECTREYMSILRRFFHSFSPQIGFIEVPLILTCYFDPSNNTVNLNKDNTMKKAFLNQIQFWFLAPSEIDTSDEGVKLFYETLNAQGNVNVTIGDTQYSINSENYVSSGSSKAIIYDLSDGNVIAVQQVNYETWKRMTEDEVNVSNKLRTLGLLTPNQQRCIASINNKKFIVLKMPHFNHLITQGIQVRRLWYGKSFGNTLLFGNLGNFLNLNYWQSLFQHLKQDIIITLANGVLINVDSKYIAIIDTQSTLKHDVNVPGLISDRNQQLHAYFFDFSHKVESLQYNQCFYFVDFQGTGEILEENVKEEVAHVAGTYLSQALNAVTSHEYILLTGKENSGLGLWCWAANHDVYKEFKSQFESEIVTGVIAEIEKLTPEQKKERFSEVPTRRTLDCSVM